MVPVQRKDRAMTKHNPSVSNHATANPAAPGPAPERSWHGSVNGHAQAVVLMGRGDPRSDALAPLPR